MRLFATKPPGLDGTLLPLLCTSRYPHQQYLRNIVITPPYFYYQNIGSRP